MASEDAFKAAKTAFTFFYAYHNTIAQEIGRERAVALLNKTFESMGARQGKMLKEQSGITKLDAKSAIPLLKSAKDSVGIGFEVVEESPQRVVLRNGRCPFYESAQAAGVDAKFIETLCHSGPMRMADSLVKQINPNLSIGVRKFRSTPSDFCDEEIVLG
jgi:hypothetical protein